MNYTKGKRRVNPYGDGTFYVDTEDFEIASKFKNKADAQLDAAAPDMYEALTFAARQIKELHKLKGEFGLTNAILGLAEQVIAKAEGK